jgi:hypothetical protein
MAISTARTAASFTFAGTLLSATFAVEAQGPALHAPTDIMRYFVVPTTTVAVSPGFYRLLVLEPILPIAPNPPALLVPLQAPVCGTLLACP